MRAFCGSATVKASTIQCKTKKTEARRCKLKLSQPMLTEELPFPQHSAPDCALRRRQCTERGVRVRAGSMNRCCPSPPCRGTCLGMACSLRSAPSRTLQLASDKRRMCFGDDEQDESLYKPVRILARRPHCPNLPSLCLQSTLFLVPAKVDLDLSKQS